MIAMLPERSTLRRCSAFLLLLCLLLMSVAGSAGAGAAPGNATQTMMIYMVGSDLEQNGGVGTKDIAEMLKARPDAERLRVVVMTGGSLKWFTPVIPADEVCVFEIAGSAPKLVHRLPDQSMGDKGSLSAFLHYGVENYPADSYSLVLWNHGGGPLEGFGIDMRHGLDSLSLPELRQALRESPFTGGNKLAWLGFDACLMASAEVASMMADHADYMIASQETIPGEGWDYSFLREYAATSMTGETAMELITDRYFDYYEAKAQKRSDYNPLLTLSCLDLSRMPALEDALNGLFSKMDVALADGSYSMLARSRNEVKSFGGFSAGVELDLADIGDLAEEMSAFYPEECTVLIDVLAELVVQNRSNQAYATGVSLYYPFANKETYQSKWGQAYETLGFAGEYTRYMSSFGQVLVGDSLEDWKGDKAPSLVLDKATQQYYIQLSPQQAENFAQAEYRILGRLSGEQYHSYYVSSDVTLDENLRLKANFDGNVLYLRSKKSGFKGLPYLFETEVVDGVSRYRTIVGLSRFTPDAEEETRNATLMLSYDRNTGQGSVISATDIVNIGDPIIGKSDFPLSDWHQIQMNSAGYDITRDAEGNLLPFRQWTGGNSTILSFVHIHPELEFVYEPLLPDERAFFCLITMYDTQGNSYTAEPIPIEVPQGQSNKAEALGPWDPPFTPYAANSGAVLPLVEKNGVKVTLNNLRAGLGEYDNPLLMADLHVENSTPFAAFVSTNSFVVNGCTIESHFFAALPANAQVDKVAGIKIPYARDGSLQEAGIEVVEELSFGLRIRTYDDDHFTAPVGVQTSIPVAEYFKTTAPQPNLSSLPLHPTKFSGEAGIDGEFLGLHEDGDNLLLFFRFDNHSSEYDRVELQSFAINGVSVSEYGLYVDIMPHTTAYGTYFALYKSELEALGITEYATLGFTMVCERFYSLLESAPQHFTLKVPGMEGYQQPLDTKGRVLLEQEGLRVVQQGEYALLVQNLNDFSIYFSMGDAIFNELVDTYNGMRYAYRELGPHQSAMMGIKLRDDHLVELGIETINSLSAEVVVYNSETNVQLFPPMRVKLK